MQKKWLYVLLFILMAVGGYYLYQKYRVAPELKMAELPLENLSGEPVSLSVFRGQKTALKQPFSVIGINSIPTSYLVNRKGVIVKQKVGYIDWEDPSTSNYMLGLME
jgi:hypothetical protein